MDIVTNKKRGSVAKHEYRNKYKRGLTWQSKVRQGKGKA